MTPLEFLQTLFPGELPGQIAICSKWPDGGWKEEWFTNVSDAGAKASKLAKKADVYFTVGIFNESAAKDEKREATRVVALPGLWIDIDIKSAAHSQQALPATVEEAQSFFPSMYRPTLVVDSGHGLHAYWLFQEPWLLTTPEAHARATALAIAWQSVLRRRAEEKHGWKLDNTSDLARVLRLPGTMNRKHDPVPVEIIGDILGPYTPEGMENIPEVKKELEASGDKYGDKNHPDDLADLDLIVTGCAFMQHCRDDQASLSEPEWYAALSIIGRTEDGEQHAHEWSKDHPKYSRAETDKKLAQALKKSGPITCARVANLTGNKFCQNCQFNNNKIKSPIVLGGPGLSFIEEMNSRYAYVVLGNSGRVLREDEGIHGPEITFILKGAFLDRHNIEKVRIGKKATRKAGDFWFDHSRRRTYDGVVFAPKTEVPGYYNLWRGFAVEPNDTGDISLFMEHLRENVASGNEAHFQWILGWMAQIFQQPTLKVGTSLVIQGEMGTGKTKIGEVLAQLLGAHYLRAEREEHVTGKFNKHLASCLLLHADEAFFAGDQSGMSILRGMVTSDTTLLEPKGIDLYSVRNYMRLLITSHEEWVARVAMQERRFAVFKTGVTRMRDHAFFDAIDRQFDIGAYAKGSNGGAGRLLKFFLDFDLSKVNLRVLPATQALEEQMKRSLPTLEQFWYWILWEGQIPDRVVAVKQHDEEWPLEVTKMSLWEAYIDYAKKVNDRHPKDPAVFFKQLLKLCPHQIAKFWMEYPDDTGGKKKPVPTIRIPTLQECRVAFNICIARPIEWPNPGTSGVAPLPGRSETQLI